MANEKPVSVGIIGLGRAGWGIHVATITQPVVAKKFRIVAVSDLIGARMDEAKAAFGCRTYANMDDLLADKEVELVVVATFNNLHVPHSIAALKAGKHVLCEKPMATSLADADRAIQAAKESGKILTYDHQMRFEPAHCKVVEVIQSGKLGEIILMHLSQHMFRRRWDWQTLKQVGGGEMNNNGTHLVDEALQFLGEDVTPKVTSDLRRTPNCAGDADDHVKINLMAPGKPTIDVEVSNSMAMGAPHYQVFGTYGALVGDMDKLTWRFINPASLDERLPDPNPTPDRSYNRYDLPWQEEGWSAGNADQSGYVPLYLSLYETLRHGAPLAITPESVRRNIAVLEECRRQSALYSA